VQTDTLLQSLLFRTPGLDTVERVVQGLDQGEPHHGLASGLIEAGSILMPRAVWPQKPQSGGLTFDDIFFYDFYVGRGDPVDGIRSGISPTIVGEALWIGGIPMVLIESFTLGLFTVAATAWRRRGSDAGLYLFTYAIVAANFFIFVDAPQNALNSFVMIAALLVFFVLALTVRLRPANPLRRIS